MVFFGFKTTWRLATSPTRFLVGSTTEGVIFLPVSTAGITFGLPPSITATTLFVVPKSIPTILLILVIFSSFQLFFKFFFLFNLFSKHLNLCYPYCFSCLEFPTHHNQLCNSALFPTFD